MYQYKNSAKHKREREGREEIDQKSLWTTGNNETNAIINPSLSIITSNVNELSSSIKEDTEYLNE